MRAQGPVNVSPDDRINALNAYVYFTNESIHGLLIVQRLLENYNQEINKYVDLESNQLNFYSNKDLPGNIFIDEENWFYDTSPYEWYQIIQDQKSLLPQSDVISLDLHASNMKKVIAEVNAKRFEIEKYINSHNLNDSTQLQGVYDLLERCVTLYESFFTAQKGLEVAMKACYNKIKTSAADSYEAMLQEMTQAYGTSRAIMLAIRNKQDNGYETYVSEQRNARDQMAAVDFARYNNTKILGAKVTTARKNIITQLDNAIRSGERFYTTADVDPGYKLYGKFYYYYNSELINKFNRYGNGLVFEINRIMDLAEMPVLRFTELPHYFKVIYPVKITQDVITASDENISSLPDQLRDRKISNNLKNSIKVDSDVVEFSLYDHFIEDGDIVDINFNGDWIIDSLTLVTEPKMIKLKLNDEGRNYIILHARNVGTRPPNTMAVKYVFRGRERQIIMSSDLNTSELIEIVRVD